MLDNFPVDNNDVRSPRYWRIDIPEQAEHWSVMHEGRFVGIGWWQLGDLSKRLSGISRLDAVNNIAAFLSSHFHILDKTSVKYGRQWYAFAYEIQPGDVVVAMVGKKIQGIGIVRSNYEYNSADTLLPHHLPVSWAVTEEHLWKDCPGRFTTVYEFSRKPDSVAYVNKLLSANN